MILPTCCCLLLYIYLANIIIYIIINLHNNLIFILRMKVIIINKINFI